MNFPTTQQLHLQALNSLKAVRASNNNNNVASPPTRAPSSTKPPPRSKPAAKAISIQHMTVQKSRPNQRLLYDIINFLKDAEKPVTAAEIHEHTGHDLKTIPGLLETLQANIKISYEDGWFSYKPPYSIKNIHELLDLINKTADGIEVSELRDCYKTVEEDIKKLKEQNDVVTIMNADTKTDNVYPNDARYRIAVADEFKNLWRGVPLPASDVDLEREMRAAGITMIEEEEDKGPTKRPSKKDKKQQRKRIVKYTNTHILPGSGIDLSKDYIPDKKP